MNELEDTLAELGILVMGNACLCTLVALEINLEIAPAAGAIPTALAEEMLERVILCPALLGRNVREKGGTAATSVKHKVHLETVLADDPVVRILNVLELREDGHARPVKLSLAENQRVPTLPPMSRAPFV